MGLETAIAAAEAAETDYDDLLTDTCTIRRATMGTTRDSYGNFPPTWNDLATLVVCRLDEGNGREVYVDKNLTVVDYFLFLKASQDVTARDRITSVVRGGVTIFSNEAEVTNTPVPGGLNHHKEALLVRVKV